MTEKETSLRSVNAHRSAVQADDARLSHLPEHVRNHPLFRQGYDLGYSDRAHDEHLAEIRHSGLRHGDAPQPPRSYGVDTGGLRGRLIAGARVLRELSVVSEREFITEVPCCGRRITIPVLDDDQTSPAACCHCRVLYAAALAEEEPDGYHDEPSKVAVFIVEHANLAAARHRAGRWELPRCPQRSRGTK